MLLQKRAHDLRGAHLFEAELGVLMNVVTDLFEQRQQEIEFAEQLVRDHASGSIANTRGGDSAPANRVIPAAARRIAPRVASAVNTSEPTTSREERRNSTISIPCS